MENEYAIFAFDKTFAITFNWSYFQFNHFEEVTTCAIIELPENHVYAGATIKNPHDIPENVHIARRWAYKRAVYYLWVVWTDLKKCNCAWECFWQTFRKALASNELYLKDRKEK